MKKTTTKLIEVDGYYCDDCDEKITLIYSSRQCNYCFRDCCSKHRVENPLADNSGERVDYVCIDCFKIMKPFVEKIKSIQEKSDTEIEKLEKEMERLCKKYKKDKSK